MWRRRFLPFFAPENDNGNPPPPGNNPPPPGNNPPPPGGNNPPPPGNNNPPPPAAGDWRVIPEDFKGPERDQVASLMKKYTSPFELAKAGVHAQNRASKAIMPLGENPTPEDIATYRKSLNIPNDLAEYGKAVKFTPGQHFKMDSENGQKLQAGWHKMAHDLNMTPAQAGAALQYLTGVMDEHMGAEGKKREEALTNADKELRRIWPGDQYDKNYAIANAFIMGRDPDPALVKLFQNATVDGVALEHHPVMVQWAARRGAALGEGNLIMVTDSKERQDGQASMADLTKQIFDARDAGDYSKAAQLEKQRSELSAKLHGTGAAGT